MSVDKIRTASQLLHSAREKRRSWEQIWRECCAFTQPYRQNLSKGRGLISTGGVESMFDSTAVEAAEQLSASLVAELLPPWSTWFSFRPGSDVASATAGAFAEELESIAKRLQGHFDRSNFGVELHQSFLEMVTLGTATLQFEEAPVGEPSAFRFSAVPANEIFLDGDHTGRITRHLRVSNVSTDFILRVFPAAQQPLAQLLRDEQARSKVHCLVEAVSEGNGGACEYLAFIDRDEASVTTGVLLKEGTFETSPFITFRWAKSAGDIYGRSPVMSALPDIKTANKVVELILRNASIAATGIWLAEDDGILNPANISLTPGTIIPKAVGSAGLTPLQAPGRFDVSQLILDDLRTQIRHTMLVDKFGPAFSTRMTATEVIERTTEASRILGAVFGRLQSELIRPLVSRALAILSRRGEIPRLPIDGGMVDFTYNSPLARAQARQDARNTLVWLDGVKSLGPAARSVVDERMVAIWLARALGVDQSLVIEND